SSYAARLNLCRLSRRRDAQNEIENSKRGGLGERTDASNRSYASGAAHLTATVGNEPPRTRQQLVVHVVERRAESDAARIIVVDEDSRTWLATCGYSVALHLTEGLALRGIDRDADVVGVAHQQELSDLPHGVGETHDAVSPIVGGERQLRHDVGWNRQPV